MSHTFQIHSPVDGRLLFERAYADDDAIAHTLVAAREAQTGWRQHAVAERAALCTALVDHIVGQKQAIAEELTWQMGRPVVQTPGEVGGFEERARYMISIAEEVLADVWPEPKAGFTRFIRREPLGTVLVLSPWNYPYLTAVNAVVPALMAGNVVLLKHAGQTALCAERFAEAAQAAGFPEGVFQALHMTHEAIGKLLRGGEVDFVAFTGSVAGGHAVNEAASEQFIGVGLELGGKDPAYVRPDAPFDATVEHLVDGVFFNAGQSCCAVERIYVHQDYFDRFVEAFVAQARAYRLGNPLEPETNLGPLVRTRSADFVRAQIREAVDQGARALVDEAAFRASKAGTPYLAPQVLVDVHHGMRIMTEETFGPAVGIMPVASDDEAVALMNDSPYGLTASIWTSDEDAALRLGAQVETGTCFMNRCDYLDPALAWTGVKDSGRGCTLSRIGYEHLTRPKSFHLRQVG